MRNKLLQAILTIENMRENFVLNPERDFTRKRSISIPDVFQFVLGLEGKSLESELLEHYNFSKNVVSSSAMLQARRKLKLSAFETVFKSISSHLTREKTYRGYRLLAHDGT
ncbi:transposase, partial [Bacillus cereus]